MEKRSLFIHTYFTIQQINTHTRAAYNNATAT